MGVNIKKNNPVVSNKFIEAQWDYEQRKISTWVLCSLDIVYGLNETMGKEYISMAKQYSVVEGNGKGLKCIATKPVYIAKWNQLRQTLLVLIILIYYNLVVHMYSLFSKVEVFLFSQAKSRSTMQTLCIGNL